MGKDSKCWSTAPWDDRKAERCPGATCEQGEGEWDPGKGKAQSSARAAPMWRTESAGASQDSRRYRRTRTCHMPEARGRQRLGRVGGHQQVHTEEGTRSPH